MRSIRRELAAAGLRLAPGADLSACDDLARLAALGLVQAGVAVPLPAELLDTLTTFDDLAHFANLRVQQEGGVDVWEA